MTIAYRAAELADAQFIVSAWSSSYKASYQAGMIGAEDWAKVMHPQIQRVLNLPGARAVIAFENTDPDFTYGFIAVDTSERLPVVFYVYVKEPYRRAGYARGLFAAAGIDPNRRFVYACSTPIVLRLKAEEKIPRAKFNAEPARYPKEQRTRRSW